MKTCSGSGHGDRKQENKESKLITSPWGPPSRTPVFTLTGPCDNTRGSDSPDAAGLTNVLRVTQKRRSKASPWDTLSCWGSSSARPHTQLRQTCSCWTSSLPSSLCQDYRPFPWVNASPAPAEFGPVVFSGFQEFSGSRAQEAFLGSCPKPHES